MSKQRQYVAVRIIEYSGPLDWIEDTLQKSAVFGKRKCGPGREIREIYRSIPMEHAIVEIPDEDEETASPSEG